jgi:CubicO group peptidase (beta-lactamase class C family)
MHLLLAALLGLWGSETTFGPQVRGPITLERQASNWTMRVGGFEVTDTDLHLVLPGGQGELRASLDGTTLRGFWIQPRGNLGRFATPVTFTRVRADAWRGTVTPLDDRLSLYLNVAKNEDGTLRGSFHNPEVNWDGRAAWFRLEEKDESLHLIDPKTGKTRFVQPYDAREQKIIMDFGAPIALTPRTPEQAVGFQPRAAKTYRYRTPLPGGDGWRVSRAKDEGVDEERLRALVERILAIDPVDRESPRIHSLLVARHGKLVLEEYFFGFDESRPHDLRSASKVFTSMMFGIAMADAVHAPIDPKHPKITAAHLLSHTSGLACDDDDEKSPGNEDVMQGQREQPDWYRYFLDLPALHEPGTKYVYCSGGINYAGALVAKKTGAWLPDFFDRAIARPLQFGTYHMNLQPDGQAYSGGGIYLRPRDFLKLGQTYLDGGLWNGKRIVPKEWVRTSTANSYAWHRHVLNGRQTYEASGNGGQFAIVVPELDLVVAITAGNYGQYGVWRTFREELVPSIWSAEAIASAF